MKKIIFYILFLFLAFFKGQDIQKKVLDSLFTLYEKKDRLYGTVEMTEEGRILYSKSFGYLDVNKNIRNDSVTIYPIGRTTELFVQIIFFQMQEEKKINFSDKLSIYYPEIPDSDKVTLGNFLQHQSKLQYADSIQTINTRERLIEYIKRNPQLKDQKTTYSNLNYILLGFILEDVSGESFEDLLLQRIIAKLELKNTFYEKIPTDRNIALSYYKQSGKWKRNFKVNFAGYYGTASGMYSNPHDLNILLTALYKGELFDKKIINKYYKEQDYKKSFFEGYDKKLELAYLSKKIKGFQIKSEYSVKQKRCITIISNANDNMELNFLLKTLNDAYFGNQINFPTILKD